jgi:hypothetical protein
LFGSKKMNSTESFNPLSLEKLCINTVIQSLFSEPKIRKHKHGKALFYLDFAYQNVFQEKNSFSLPEILFRKIQSEKKFLEDHQTDYIVRYLKSKHNLEFIDDSMLRSIIHLFLLQGKLISYFKSKKEIKRLRRFGRLNFSIWWSDEWVFFADWSFFYQYDRIEKKWSLRNNRHEKPIR